MSSEASICRVNLGRWALSCLIQLLHHGALGGTSNPLFPGWVEDAIAFFKLVKLGPPGRSRQRNWAAPRSFLSCHCWFYSCNWIGKHIQPLLEHLVEFSGKLFFFSEFLVLLGIKCKRVLIISKFRDMVKFSQANSYFRIGVPVVMNIVHLTKGIYSISSNELPTNIPLFKNIWGWILNVVQW